MHSALLSGCQGCELWRLHSPLAGHGASLQGLDQQFDADSGGLPSKAASAALWQLTHTLQALDHWEERLEAAFEGRPYDILDAALTATVAEFPVSIQPFRDMIGAHRAPAHAADCAHELGVGAQLCSRADGRAGGADGMRMDLVKSRYNTFDELYEYCYKVAGTVGAPHARLVSLAAGSELCKH